MSFLFAMILQMLVGTYGEQIYKMKVDSVTFEILGCDTVAVDNASYLALSSDGKYFYTVSESGADSKISSFENKFPYRRLSCIEGVSMDPCFIVTRDVATDQGLCTYLMTGDYSGGSISVFPVEEGYVKPASQVVRFNCSGLDTVRQRSSHIHQFKSSGKWLFASDLGGDRLHVLKISQESGLHLDSLFDVRTAPGSGPRHMAINAKGTRLYLLSEVSCELYVYMLKEDRTGDNIEMRLIQRLFIGDSDDEVIANNPLVSGVNTQAGGDIQLHPNGKYLYASLRNGANKIAIFELDSNGMAARKSSCSTALHPRNFTILPDGCTMIVPCKNSDLIQFFQIDPVSGLMSEMAEKRISAKCPVLTVIE